MITAAAANTAAPPAPASIRPTSSRRRLGASALPVEATRMMTVPSGRPRRL